MQNLPDDIAEKLRASLDAGISDETMTKIKKKLDDINAWIEDDVMYRLKDDLAPNLMYFVADCAKRVVEAIIDGSDEQMKRYLGCDNRHHTGRSDHSTAIIPARPIEEWHPVIHRELFDQGAVALRRKIVEAHRDLITDQRVLDLEDQVKALVAREIKHRHQIDELQTELMGYRRG